MIEDSFFFDPSDQSLCIKNASKLQRKDIED